MNKNDRKQRNEINIKTVLGIISVSVVYGLGWVFGAFTIGEAQEVFAYLFVICNVFQGFIFSLFIVVVSPDGRDFWRNLLKLNLRKIISFHSTGKSSQGLTLSTKLPIMNTLERTLPNTLKNSNGAFGDEDPAEKSKQDEANEETQPSGNTLRLIRAIENRNEEDHELHISGNTFEMSFTNQAFSMGVCLENSHSDEEQPPENFESLPKEVKIMIDSDSAPDTIAVNSPIVVDTQID